MTGSRPKCVLVLTVWLVGITFAGFAVAPGLSRISYPQPLDLLVLAFIPVGAFHAAKYAEDQLIFLLYGCLASTAFAFNFTIGQGRIGLTLMYHPEQAFSLVVVASMVMLGFGFLCRAMPGIRARYQNRRRVPLGCCEHCGYDLTGNTSGTCPECGMAAMQADAESCLRFVPSRVDGVGGVTEVAVYPDRLDIRCTEKIERFRFDRMAAKRIRWRHYLRLRAYPKTPAARKVIQPQAKWRKAT